MKKNCYNCAELYYNEEQDSDGYVIGSGYNCDKRYEKAEDSCGGGDAFLQKLTQESYLKKSKVCFASKEGE